MSRGRTALAAFAVAAAVVAVPASPLDRAKKAPPVVGVHFHCNWTDYDDRSRRLVADRLAGAAATWVRIDLGWINLKPTQNGPVSRRYLARFERCVAIARRRGLRVLATLGWTPRWASRPGTDRSPPTRPGDFAVIARFLARHFRGRVSAWEVWNEPNLAEFWTGAPEDYARLLRAAYPAFKRGDPSALVVLGGVSTNDDGFLRRVYAAGAKGSFDVLATHPYQGVADAPPEQADDGERWWITHVTAVRNLMVEYGDGDRPIWFTEVGWSVHPNAPDTPAWRRGVTERQQADYAARLLALVRSTYPYVTHVFWYNERSRADERDAHLRGFGLLRPGLAPRPVYFALRDRP